MALYGVSYLWWRWPVTYPDQSGDPTVFPFLPGQMFLIEKTPTWSTIVAKTASGRERRASYWSAPVWSFKMKFDFLRSDSVNLELQQLLAFFQGQNGQFNTWKYYDRYDNAVTAQPFGIADGVTTTWQLVRYINGNANSVEPVYALNGAPSVYVNGTLTTVTLGSNGAVTFATAPTAGAALTWTGSFFFLCRFDDDKISPGQPFQTIWDLGDLTFSSIKPDRYAA